MPTLHTAGLTGGRGTQTGTGTGTPFRRRQEAGLPGNGHSRWAIIPAFPMGASTFRNWSCFISLRHPPMQTSNTTCCCRRMEICCGKMGGRSAMEPWELTSKKCKKKEDRNKQRVLLSLPGDQLRGNGLESPAISPPSPHRIVSSRFQIRPIIHIATKNRNRLFFKLQTPNQATDQDTFPLSWPPPTRPRVTAQASAKPPAR